MRGEVGKETPKKEQDLDFTHDTFQRKLGGHMIILIGN